MVHQLIDAIKIKLSRVVCYCLRVDGWKLLNFLNHQEKLVVKHFLSILKKVKVAKGRPLIMTEQ